MTQGNMQAVAHRHTGRAIVFEKKTPDLKAWRHAINDEARQARGEAPILEGPVRVVLTFRLAQGTGESGTCSPWAHRKACTILDTLAE